MEWNTPGYMVREELQRDRLIRRGDRRAWAYEKKLEDGGGNEIARKCWIGMTDRFSRNRVLFGWEEERKIF